MTKHSKHESEYEESDNVPDAIELQSSTKTSQLMIESTMVVNRTSKTEERSELLTVTDDLKSLKKRKVVDPDEYFTRKRHESSFDCTTSPNGQQVDIEVHSPQVLASQQSSSHNKTSENNLYSSINFSGLSQSTNVEKLYEHRTIIDLTLDDQEDKECYNV